MDSVTIEKRGYAPIRTDLERISQIKTIDGVVNEVTFDRVNGVNVGLYTTLALVPIPNTPIRISLTSAPAQPACPIGITT
jgi:hypothetical protein